MRLVGEQDVGEIQRQAYPSSKVSLIRQGSWLPLAPRARSTISVSSQNSRLTGWNLLAGVPRMPASASAMNAGSST